MNDQFYKDLLKILKEISTKPLNGTFVVQSDSGSQFSLKKNGNEPWYRKVGGFRCMSVYKAIRMEDDEINPIDVIKALKKPSAKGKIRVPKGTLDEIIEEASDLTISWLDANAIDFITTPQSSKTLAVKFAKRISNAMGKNFVPAATVKDLENARISDEIPASFNPKSVRGLERSLERMKNSEDKDLHTHFRSQDRKFIRGWQRIRPGSGLMQNTNALIVDDVISNGSTIVEMAKTLEEFGVTVVGCITLFQT